MNLMAPEYSEGKDEAAQIARVALPLANKYDLPANPINYAVLYEFVVGQNSELIKAIENTLIDGGKPSNTQVRDFYHTYISHSDEQAVESVREVLSTLVDNTGRSLSRMGGESEVFRRHLSHAAEQLKQGEQSVSLKLVVDGLIQETEQIRVSSLSLQEELSQAQQELEDLRNEFKRVRHEALVDPLTGIQNRRAFDSDLDANCLQASENGTPLSLLLLDIDHFKSINDRFGHLAGDAVLKWFATIVKDTVKGTDSVARYGGEEFSVLLPNTQLPGARIVAENIRKRVCEQKLRVGQHQIGHVTCSIGASLFRSDDDAQVLIANADMAMYQAKQSGRNKVCLYGVG